jgi:uncharacterized protein (TIGR03118 family)
LKALLLQKRATPVGMEEERMMNVRVVHLLSAVVTLSFLPSLAYAQHYDRTDLVSNTATAPVVGDQNVRNAWGLVHSATSPWWISNNATGTSTLVNASTSPVTVPSTVVTIPAAPSQGGGGTPTGVVFNGSATDFLLAPGRQALFIWVTEDGTVSGWNPAVDATNAIIMADNSQRPRPNHGAVYKGATIGEIDGQRYLFAANFRSGRIDVFDSTFTQIRMSGDAFNDERIPRGFAPFNIQGIGNNLYVTYAKQDDTQHDEVAGAGLGFVDVFNTRGGLVARLQRGDFLNAPWGITLAPAYFGEFSHAVLIGNFGDGAISAFNAVTGEFIGSMRNEDGSKLKIDGLWGLAFGNGGSSGAGNALFFTAGPNDEGDGVFGMLTAVAAENDNDEP